MPNIEALEALKSGRAEWEKFRARVFKGPNDSLLTDGRIDLRSANLSYMDLKGYDLSRVDFSNLPANRKIKPANAEAGISNLLKTIGYETSGEGKNIEAAVLERTDLSFANLSGALLIDSDTGTLSQLLAELLEEEKRPVVIDDIDRFETAERELFHLINASMRSGRPVLMTASGPVERWAFVTDDLKSRARLATRFELSEPDDVELTQIFVKLLADRQLSVDLSVVSYLMARMERSMQDVVGMVHLLDRLSLAKGRAITRALAAEALAMREQAPQNEETDDE